MHCNRVQELIATDYMDLELQGAEHGRVKSHIDQCVSCREYYQEIVHVSRIPFRDTPPLSPPEAVWNRIQAVIDSRQPEAPPARHLNWSAALETFLPRLSALMPKPAWGAMAFGMMLLAALVVVRPFEPKPEQQTILGEEFLYLAGIDSGILDEEGEELGMGLELFLG